MKMDQVELLNYINSLKGYQGYIQMSDKPISDIWKNFSEISFSPVSGFVYEAHFFNGADSVSIKQINSSWLVDETKNVPLTDTEIYFAKDGLKVQMAQIWEAENDPLCEDMKVLKLKKVVFAGFAKGDDK
ncbi:MAG: TIGR04423 family type III CRISPR-associated protein [Sulfurimonas sp.]|uniref:TIGR04423 family type III CRISPR-associated protein n=1 Tax=Sulfurimonas sp. TaxID=2022749 RepID=UPI003D0CBB86